MLLDLTQLHKHGAQVALKLVELMRRVAQHAPTEHDSAVVLFQVAEVSDWSDVPTANPHTAFDFDGDLKAWPREVEAPAAFGVEAMFAFWRGEAELTGDDRDSGKRH